MLNANHTSFVGNVLVDALLIEESFPSINVNSKSSFFKSFCYAFYWLTNSEVIKNLVSVNF